MNISMLFEFPGILILIGFVLLIIALVVGIIAYKSEDEDDVDDTIAEDITLKDEVMERPVLEKVSEVKEDSSNGEDVSRVEKTPLVEDSPTKEDTSMDEGNSSDTVVSNDTVIASDTTIPNDTAIASEITKNIEEKEEVTINEVLVEEDVPKEKIENLKFVEEEAKDDTFSEILVDTPSYIDDDVNTVLTEDEYLKMPTYEEEIDDFKPTYNPELEATRTVYGGTRPLENIDLNFTDEVHEAYSKDYTKKDDITNYQIPKTNTKNDENIEIL